MKVEPGLFNQLMGNNLSATLDQPFSEFYGKVVEQISSIGLSKGDLVLVRSDLSTIRFPRHLVGHIRDTNKILLSALREVIGEGGTVICKSFTSSGMQLVKKVPLFTMNSRSSSGTFPNYLISHPDGFRSSHPTNSWVAIGKDAKNILQFHDENSSSFAPINRLIALGGKQLILGCVTSSPGTGSEHAAQHALGYSTKSLLSGLIQARYKSAGGEIATFRKVDIPGCSSGFFKLYPLFRKANMVKEGAILGLNSMLIRAEDSYNVTYNLLQSNPQALRCDNRKCADCNFFSYAAKGHRLRYLTTVAPVRILRGR
jgi:aminoglycoside N3'-acetyltransferase